MNKWPDPEIAFLATVIMLGEFLRRLMLCVAAMLVGWVGIVLAVKLATLRPTGSTLAGWLMIADGSLAVIGLGLLSRKVSGSEAWRVRLDVVLLASMLLALAGLLCESGRIGQPAPVWQRAMPVAWQAADAGALLVLACHVWRRPGPSARGQPSRDQ